MDIGRDRGSALARRYFVDTSWDRRGGGQTDTLF
jgi:hypothetical protein